MKGLLKKDMALMFQRKQTVVIFLIIFVMMGMTQSIEFVIPYCSMLVVMMAFGTTSYDESNHGFAWLMTLPVKRSTYVAEKYLFCVLWGLAGWCGTFILYILGSTLMGKTVDLGPEVMVFTISILMFIILVLDLMIPVQLKFGQERSRYVLIAVVCVTVCGGVTIGKLFKETPVQLVNALVFLSKNPAVILVGVLIVVAALTRISMKISTGILTKKEF